MIRRQILQAVFVISFLTLYSNSQEENCPLYTDNEVPLVLTYDEFRNSTDTVVRIYDVEEKPISLSSFYVTRNKIYQYASCTNGRWDDEQCEQWNNDCEEKPGIYLKCTETEQYPKLSYLDISEGGLQNIHPKTFVTISNCLQYLILKDNLITKLPAEIFSTLNNLQYLDLSHNQLTNWNCHILENIFVLEYLNLSYNKIQEFNETWTIYKNIDLSHNELLKFDFDSSPFVKYINISNNKLESIYLSNSMVQTLDVSYNFIKSLQNCILHANQLETLTASYNQINEFDLTNLIALKYLNLSNNNIEFVNSSLMPASLIELDLSNNKIKLQSGMFEYLLNLNGLLLNNNKIDYIPLNTFYGLINLKTVSLANNDLTYFEFGSFSGLINLEILDLSENKLNYFESDKLIDLNNLQTLLLDGNQYNNEFNLTDLNLKLINLRTISLSKMFWTCEKLIKTKIDLRRMNINLKQNSIRNEINYSIDGINCIPKSHDSTDYVKKSLIQSTTIQPLSDNNLIINNPVRFAKSSITSGLISNDGISLNQLQNMNSIEYNNTSISPIFLMFLQNMNKIITNETNELKNSFKKLENTTTLLLHKIERLEEINYSHKLLGSKIDTDIKLASNTTEAPYYIYNLSKDVDISEEITDY